MGRRLKLFQRQDALKRGIDLVEWTFDPLDLKNAHFNFVRLGAIARKYIPDCYGVTQSPLHAGLPTDRLVAEWWLASERVKSILADNPSPVKDSAQRISVPANLAEIRDTDREAAARLQTLTRGQFQQSLDAAAEAGAKLFRSKLPAAQRKPEPRLPFDEPLS